LRFASKSCLTRRKTCDQVRADRGVWQPVDDAINETPIVIEAIGSAHQRQHAVACVLERQVKMGREPATARRHQIDDVRGAIHGPAS
jgi:hypothetical protein